METFIPWALVKRGIRREIITPLNAPQAFTVEAATERTKRKAAQNTPLFRALGQAHDWQRLLDEGKIRSMTDIAAAEGIDVTQARKEAEKFRKLAQSWSSRARGKDPRVRMAA